MPKPLTIKGIKRVKKKLADGSIKVYYFHRASMAPLDPASLVMSFAEAEKRYKARFSDGLMVKLIRLFDGSEYFKDLAADTRKEYIWKLRKVEERWGSCPISVFNSEEDSLAFRKDALAWHEALGRGSRRSADNLMAALAVVLSFAKKRAEIKFNPIDTFTRLYKSSRAEKIWPPELQEDFLKVARSQMVTAMIIARNTGQRAHDIRTFAWSKYDGAKVQVRQAKTGKLVTIPATRELKTHLDGLERKGALVLLTPRGKGFTRRRFNEMWLEDAKKVGAEDLHFHDLRGTAATRLAERGATVFEIADLMGWSIEKSQKIISAYIATTGKFAAKAAALLEQE